MILDPPAAYDFPYPGPLTVWEHTPAKVDELCRRAGAKAMGVILECTFKLGDHCFVIIPFGDKQLLRHGTGHCNGWVHQ